MPHLNTPQSPGPPPVQLRTGTGCRRLRPGFRLAFLIFLAPLAPVFHGTASSQSRYDFPPDTTRVADQSLYFETNLGLIERATTEAVDQTLEGLRLPPGSDILLHCMTVRDDSWFVEDYIARRLNQMGYNVHTADVTPKEGTEGTAGTTSTPGAGKSASSPGGLGDAMRQTNPGLSDTTGADSSMADAAATGADTPPPPRRPRADVRPRINDPQPPKEEPEELIPVPEGQGLVLTYRLVEFGVTYHDSWRRGFMGPRVVERLASVNLYCRLVSGGPKNVLWVGRGKSERLDIVPKSKLDLLEGLSYPFTKPVLRPQPLSRFLEPVLVTSIIGGLVYLFYTNQE